MTLQSFFKALARFILKPLSFVPALIIMYTIFSFSSQTGTQSSELSYKVSQKIIITTDRILELNLSDSQIHHSIEHIHFYVRKLAHFSEYFLLAVTVAFPLYVYGVRGIWLTLTAGMFCVGFASLDEFHQRFVAGRGPSPRDVIIDSCGSLTGIIFTRIICYIGRKTIFAPLSKE